MKSKLFLLLIFLIQTELSFQMFVNKTVIYNKIFQSVTELNLNGMKIDYIDKKSFEDISKLKKLYLNNNLISFVDASMFEGMLYNYLKVLSIFTSIYRLIIVKGLNDLEEIWLESNNIVVFDLNSLVGLNKLLKVCIYNNPISKYFPEKLQKICETNPNCIVKISETCSFPDAFQTNIATTTTTTIVSLTNSLNSNLSFNGIKLNKTLIYYIVIIKYSFVIGLRKTKNK